MSTAHLETVLVSVSVATTRCNSWRMGRSLGLMSWRKGAGGPLVWCLGGHPTMWPILWCIWWHLPLWTDRRLWKLYLPATSSSKSVNLIVVWPRFCNVPFISVFLAEARRESVVVRRRVTCCHLHFDVLRSPDAAHQGRTQRRHHDERLPSQSRGTVQPPL